MADPVDVDENFKDAFAWLDIEHKIYTRTKWSTEMEDEKSLEDWNTFISQYIHRAGVLGLDNPLGRQAIGKAASTAVAMLATIFRNYHWLPTPGYPSGEVRGDFPKVDEPEHDISGN